MDMTPIVKSPPDLPGPGTAPPPRSPWAPAAPPASPGLVGPSAPRSRTPTPPRIGPGHSEMLASGGTGATPLNNTTGMYRSIHLASDAEQLETMAVSLRNKGYGHSAALVDQATRLLLSALADPDWKETVTDDTVPHIGLLRSCNTLFSAMEDGDSDLIKTAGRDIVQSFMRLGILPYQDIRAIRGEEDMVALSAQIAGSPPTTARSVRFSPYSAVVAYFET